MLPPCGSSWQLFNKFTSNFAFFSHDLTEIYLKCKIYFNQIFLCKFKISVVNLLHFP